MPVKVTAWSCIYRCGRKVNTRRTAMLAHEERCFFNPARRACQSCGNFVHEMDTVYNPYHNGDPGSTDYEVRVSYCAADIDTKEDLHHDCPLWIPKP